MPFKLSSWLFIPILALSLETRALKVVIDPGHGGSDVGAHRNGVNESQITLKISKMLAKRLKGTEFQPHLTRSEDINLGLKERVDFAHEIKADIFLSIHANASPDKRAKGAEFYFQNQLEPSEAARYLAHQETQLNQALSVERTASMVQPHWPQSLKAIFFDLLDQSRIRQSFLLSRSLREKWQGRKKPKSLSLRQAPFQVVSQTEIPSTLVEIGFLTNPTDFKDLQSERYQQRVVDSLVQGLQDYKSQVENL